MKREICKILCGCMIAGLMAGCGEEPKEKQTDSSVKKEASEVKTADKKESAGETNIKIWHDGDESIMDTMEKDVNEMLEEEGIRVSFEKKAALTDQLKLYGTDEVNGPDMYFYAHDSLGMLAEMGILAPLSDILDTASLNGDLNEMTLEAVTYKDTQYMVPVYFETLLFLYNKGLWEGDVPDSTDELYAYMETHTDTEAGTYGVLNQHSTAYNVAPFINGFGGCIIDKEGNPGLNLPETIEAVAYNQKFAALQADGDYNTVTTLFNEGKASAIIGGPWLLSGIKDAGIDLGMKSLSEFTLPNGKALAPYSGVQGVGVLKHSAGAKKDAVEKVLSALASEKVGVDLVVNNNCASANEKVYHNSDVAANEMVLTMKKTADTAEPMPNIPQMSVMWGPAEGFLAAVNKSNEDVSQAAEDFQKEAVTAISDIQ
ncbi:MAG: extracellular solute-binding protein [Lachnospiraceae bacterium]|uniref:extracellular solute-binding protein n=1 Tax=Roseburia sp. 1XD42-69 TaxID=2320088 RepID=UPI000EA26664|nr:extracellular solute-binding protein [Roseburia sp. 1XD42-69]MCI8876155.1 extracellular solute-binding protein [Lachnospiraceae bacterium]MCX4320427.1 extracellular solute-binding protein [Lachnospiraceae bacterium]RKJ67161.1 extracellular solute-binding protein [Roseburia sp. 1XD42-69]